MTNSAINRLERLTEIIPKLLREVDEAALSDKPNAAKWSKKEIIGHLIDSAANNHQRFVRGQFEDTPRITYDQVLWNIANRYQDVNITQLITFWESYNKQLVSLLRNIPGDKLNNCIDTGGEYPLTIAFLIEDYVEHMEHHLKQVIHYE
ncbi:MULTISPECIES: DinB family protein [Pedobacter]|uniref:DinB family protein n=1 Tax=Pedobacter TaxID=84567 RepID=UPI00210EC170|nr:MULTISPECIES: DinB family protein [unclassified Pedobacter]